MIIELVGQILGITIAQPCTMDVKVAQQRPGSSTPTPLGVITVQLAPDAARALVARNPLQPGVRVGLVIEVPDPDGVIR